MSDYRFLEQAERSLYGKKYNKIVHCSQMYPVVVDFLRRGAFKRGIKLKFLSLGMHRRSTNSSMFNRRSDTLTWKVEWLFPLSEVTYSDKSVNDKSSIQSVLDTYLSDDTSDVIRQSLKKYFMNLSKVRVLMSNELTGSQKRYFVVDTSKTLSDFLIGKTIVEYPTFIVTLEQFLNRYKLISKEEEDALNNEMRERRLNRFFNLQNRNERNRDGDSMV
ncbi:box C/D snoRNA protein 1-like [Convolutriloba macropyga]|uniref:box C/D snoRNA protein 1-like n=1 Tax=Convolutriloba macropyga TaxID=536237 RepID=UPI003F523B0C